MKRILLILTLLVFIGKAVQAIHAMVPTIEVSQDAAMDDDANEKGKKETTDSYDDLLPLSQLPVAGLCLQIFLPAGPAFLLKPLMERHVPPPDYR